MRAVIMLACCVFLAGCAAHRVPLDDDGLPVTNGREMDTPAEGGTPGGRGGLWSDMLHTAMQTGMGMLHH